MNQIQVTFLDRNRGGLAVQHSIREGMTFSEFFGSIGVDTDGQKIRVLRDGNMFTPATTEEVLESDRISCTPQKIEGAFPLE